MLCSLSLQASAKRGARGEDVLFVSARALHCSLIRCHASRQRAYRHSCRCRASCRRNGCPTGGEIHSPQMSPNTVPASGRHQVSESGLLGEEPAITHVSAPVACMLIWARITASYYVQRLPIEVSKMSGLRLWIVLHAMEVRWSPNPRDVSGSRPPVRPAAQLPHTCRKVRGLTISK